MPLETRPPAVLRFGTFELNLRAGELHKKGLRVKLQEQPFRVLTLLIQRPGELVTREEFRSQIWPADTFVDFDNSLNTSINKLRETLGDSAILFGSYKELICFREVEGRQLHRQATARPHSTQNHSQLASLARQNLLLVLNWFPQTEMRHVVIATPLAERFPATPHTAV